MSIWTGLQWPLSKRGLVETWGAETDRMQAGSFGKFLTSCDKSRWILNKMILWVILPRNSDKTQRFSGTYLSHLQGRIWSITVTTIVSIVGLPSSPVIYDHCIREVWSLKFVEIICNDSVHALQEAHGISITNTGRLILVRGSLWYTKL